MGIGELNIGESRIGEFILWFFFKCRLPENFKLRDEAVFLSGVAGACRSLCAGGRAGK